MSVYNNQGPILRKSRSKSNHSLYSEHSDVSLSPPKNIATLPLASNGFHQLVQRTKFAESKIAKIDNTSQAFLAVPKPKVISEKQISKLPEIKVSQGNKIPAKSNKNQKMISNSFTNDAAQRYASFNQRQNSVEIKEEKAARGHLFSVSQAKKQRSVKRYGQLELPEQQHQKKKIESSQGGRWMRSQSLAVSREQKNFKFLIRHYHKHNSIMVQPLNRFWQFFQHIQQFYTSSVYKISLFDSLEAIKLKMQSFLQRKINLDNFQSQKPSVDWNQEQYLKYYGNYKRVLLSDTSVDQYHRPYILKKYKNCVFFGRMKDGIKEEGILQYFNGKCFQGTFKQDQKHYGLQIDEKELYLGSFKKGLRHGEGILKTAQALMAGTFTYGQFTTVTKQKQQSGTASLFANQRDQVNNSTSEHKRGFQISHSSIKIFDEGSCISKNNQGDIFIGLLGEDGEKQDEGLQLFANGDIYLGKYEAGSPQGYGQYYWENGSNYRGQFLSGMRHGRGFWQMINGDSYEGEYMNDKKNGKGVYLWKNGSRYEGNFQNDYRHGYGEMKWQDGRIYKGQWLNGIEKNTLITLQKPQVKNINAKGINNRTAFRTLQNDKRKKIPLDKLKSLYNPSYQ